VQAKTKRSSCSLRELARKAGVDVSTVSRALNNDPRISEGTAKSILSLAKSSGYRPKPLRTKRTNAIGFVMSCFVKGRPDDYYQRNIVWEAQRIFGERKIHLNVESVARDASGLDILPELVRQNRVDGVLLSGHPSVALVRAIKALDLPAVAISDLSSRIDLTSVISSSRLALTEAVSRLAKEGHKDFALLSTDLVFPSIAKRRKACIDAIKASGAELNPMTDIVSLSCNFAGGREGYLELKRRGAAPTAIICANDWMAMGVMAELQKDGLRVPDDVSIIGHDNVSLCEELSPKLSSVDNLEAKEVEIASDALLKLIETPSRPLEDIEIEGELVWRESAGPAPLRKAKRL